MTRTIQILLLAFLAAGNAAPEPEIDTWISAPEGTSLAELRGHAVLLLLDGAGASRVQHWNDLRAAYLDDGLRVVAVLESADAAPEGAEYSLAVGRAGSLAGDGAARVVLVAPDGSIAFAAKPGELTDEAVAEALRKAKDFELPSVRPAIRDAAKEFERGKLAQARSLALSAAAAAVDDLDGADAGLVAGRCDRTLASWKQDAEAAAARGDPAQALWFLDRIAKHFDGTEDAESAKARAGEIRTDAATGTEEKALDQYIRLREDLRKAGDKEKKVESWRKRAESAAERYSGTGGAARILRLVESTREDPVLGEIRAFIAAQKISKSGSTWKTSLPKPPKADFKSGKTYFWNLETSCGTMKIRLWPDVAPMHVSSTIFLTEVGFYDDLGFHRVIPGFMAQGGDPLGNGTGGPGYEYDGEFSDRAKHDRPGILSMANRGPGTDGSQFFITYSVRTNLDGKHTVFGELVSGMDALTAIEKLGSEGGATSKPVVIKRATISVE